MIRCSWSPSNLLAVVLLAAPVAAQDAIPRAVDPATPGTAADSKPAAASSGYRVPFPEVKLPESQAQEPAKPSGHFDKRTFRDMSHLPGLPVELDPQALILAEPGPPKINWITQAAERTLDRMEMELALAGVGFEKPSSSAVVEERVKRVEQAVNRLGGTASNAVMELPKDMILEQRIKSLDDILRSYHMAKVIGRDRIMMYGTVAGGIVLAVVVGTMLAMKRRRTNPPTSERSTPTAGGAASPKTLSAVEPPVEGKAPAASALRTQTSAGMKLFISFSSSDLDFVQHQLAPALREAGHKPWFSKVSIRPSDEWERSILAALRDCDWFLVVMSPNALKSKWVQLEVHWATEHREGRILPIMLERCDPWQLHMKLGNLQHVNCTRSSEAMAEIVRLIEAKEAERAAT